MFCGENGRQNYADFQFIWVYGYLKLLNYQFQPNSCTYKPVLWVFLSHMKISAHIFTSLSICLLVIRLVIGYLFWTYSLCPQSFWIFSTMQHEQNFFLKFCIRKIYCLIFFLVFFLSFFFLHFKDWVIANFGINVLMYVYDILFSWYVFNVQKALVNKYT